MAIADGIGVRHSDVNVVADLVVTIHFVVPQALHFKVRGFKVGIGYYQYPGLADQLNLGQRGALFVKQVGGNIHWYDCANLDAAVLNGFFFQQAQDGQGQRLGVADAALAGAA